MSNELKLLPKKLLLMPRSCCCESRCTKCAADNDAARAGQNSINNNQQGCSHAEKEKGASEQEVQRLQQLSQTERARVHDTTANDHEECDKKSSDDWDLADYRREDTLIQNRRSTPLDSRADVRGHGCVSRGNLVVCHVVTCWM